MTHSTFGRLSRGSLSGSSISTIEDWGLLEFVVDLAGRAGAAIQLNRTGRCVDESMNRRAAHSFGPLMSMTSAVPLGSAAVPAGEKAKGYESNDVANIASA